MQNFKHFIESYTDFAIEISKDLQGPSHFHAVQDIISDDANLKKYISMVDAVLGMSHMLALLPPTYKTNLQVLLALKNVLRHPKKIKYWRSLGYQLWKSGKLIVANPLIFISMASPAFAFLPAQKQAIILGSLKIISSIYFYLSSLAKAGESNEAIKSVLEKIQFALPEIDEDKRKSA